ncbi:MAG: DUF2189 domain-containing protein [Oxalobacteraceae bacterium]|nr:DUF2189 domain-containing protein [Oxalobacteraceae bacterium]
MPTTLPIPAAAVRSIPLLRPLQWLVLAWRDVLRCPLLSIAHGVALALFGALLTAIAHDRFWLLVGAFSGFLLVAPVLAAGLYALSRALERGEPADARCVLRTWLHWRRPDGARDTRLVRFGLLLALAGTGWVMTSAALVTALAPQPIASPIEFVRLVVLAPDNYLFELWLVLGGVLAAPVFASSVVTMPLLLDRNNISLMDAVLTSWRVILANPAPMALWSGLIMGLTLLGLASLLLGLIPLMPLLGHASWHAYRDLVQAAGPDAADGGHS